MKDMGEERYADWRYRGRRKLDTGTQSSGRNGKSKPNEVKSIRTGQSRAVQMMILPTCVSDQPVSKRYQRS